MPETKTDFEKWWHEEGSRHRPCKGEDAEIFAERIAEIAWSNGGYKAVEKIHECAGCVSNREAGGYGPRHNGSKNCESGSIASGGNRSHCSCDTCF